MYLAAFLFLTASASLPSPLNVSVDAVNTEYILRWDWSVPQDIGTVTFSADFTFDHQEEEDSSYTRVCNRSLKHWCDFSYSKLTFTGSYVLRVRAEVGELSSNWTNVKFIPDEEALLGPPQHIELEPGISMIIVTISEPSMIVVMKLSYTVQYWERLEPQKRVPKEYNSPHAPLISLKPWTEYCLQVRAFNRPYNKISPYTPEYCMLTKGHQPVWQIVTLLLSSIGVLVVLVYIFFGRNNKHLPINTAPASLQSPLISHLFLLEPREDSCTEVALVTTQTEQKQQQVANETGSQQTSCSHCWQDSSTQGPGILSGEHSVWESSISALTKDTCGCNNNRELLLTSH